MRPGDLVRMKYTMRLYENRIEEGGVSGIFYQSKVGVIIEVMKSGSSGYVKIVHPNGVGWAWINDVEVISCENSPPEMV